jgi:hypothetical protein
VVLLLTPLPMIFEVEARGDVEWWWGMVHYIFLDFLLSSRDLRVWDIGKDGWVGIPGFFLLLFFFVFQIRQR